MISISELIDLLFLNSSIEIKERAERKIKIRSRINPWSLVSREHNLREAMHEKLQLLRSITNSHAVIFQLNDSSIVLDASKYIEELKQKVEILNQDLETAQTSSDQNPLPVATVETLEKGFLVNVSSDHKSCPGLLVSILEAFEELGLNVQEARVSCADNFLLQAVGE
ncbi:transcription factor bHLH61-like isoform X3 [Juglans regia]|nr:transcription factor bHLH61-like isoform X3 [Juglans regia]